MGSTRPNPTHVGCIGLGWTSMMGWVGLNFFLPTMVGWVKKSSQPNPTRPMHTPILDNANLLASKIKHNN